eukprot:TRINITY_DN11920_c0_g2_i1.p1 TRINITY_DN11920_c0_g2~~TRINITY_DN11920_c0_g2_i1.p1  ORF type:complete len:127 (-),score=35.01 TRINITY_DN11920_c0_g2_i1:376-756(-)
MAFTFWEIHIRYNPLAEKPSPDNANNFAQNNPPITIQTQNLSTEELAPIQSLWSSNHSQDLMQIIQEMEDACQPTSNKTHSAAVEKSPWKFKFILSTKGKHTPPPNDYITSIVSKLNQTATNVTYY